MQIIKYPDWTDGKKLLSRPGDADAAARREKVAIMLEAIRQDGDTAIRRYTQQFDGIEIAELAVLPAAFVDMQEQLSADLKNAIQMAYTNIRAFHVLQREPELHVETMPGVVCTRKSVPIERVGLYVPGGSAPLFSTVLMLGIPAQLAGCQQIILCTPPQANGKVHPAILYAAQLCGIHTVFHIGGVQAIGAMAYGTDSVPQVWKIFGPGNSWVTAAKQLVSLDGVAIDMPAGPSEVCVMADAWARPDFVAADLLSQAEHGADSQVLLLTDSEMLLQAVEKELGIQLATLPRKELAAQALAQSKALLVPDLTEAMSWANAYAPEHLILQVENAAAWANKVVNAGSVFIGHYSPESAGDYASGTNHTLPTGGYAKAYSGVSVDSFIRKMTFQSITPAGLQRLGDTVITMARAEGLEAHARAVEKRIKS